MISTEKLSRKQEVIKAAASLFRKHGYAGTSMRDLAQLLGIEAASLYSHIKSKEEILHSLCFQLAHQFLDSLDNIDTVHTSQSDKLTYGLISHAEIITQDLDASAVFLNEYRHLSEPALSDFRLLRSNYVNRFKRIIRDGIKSGEFREVDVRIAVMTIFSSLNWIPRWYDPAGKLSGKEIGKRVADQLLFGLK